MCGFETLLNLLKQRIVLLDGAMGTMVQTFGLNEADYRGSRFADCDKKIYGCNDVLCVTRPGVIRNIHEQYLKAGADIIETCSFSANAISLADYGLEKSAYEISRASAEIARQCADAFSADGRPRFVAGVMGPTVKSASIAHNMNAPGERSVFWDELEAAYYDNARGLLDGGADVLLIETVFDALNAKAAIAACLRLFEERGMARNDYNPVMISATISDKSARLLCGQSLEAFCVSVLHARPLSVGLNCSLGAAALEPLVEVIGRNVPCFVSAHPNAGLPDENGLYAQDAEAMAGEIKSYFEKKLVNITGGCCGSTPAHIEKIALAASCAQPRPVPSRQKPVLRLAGLDAMTLDENAGFAVIGEGANAPGSKRFLEALKTENYDAALKLMRENVKRGVKMLDVCVDDGLLDGKTQMRRVLLRALDDPAIACVPFVLDSSDWEVLEEGLKCVAGKPLVNSINLKEGEAEFLRRAKLVMRYGAAVIVMLFDEEGQADTEEKKIAVARRSYNLLRTIDFPPENIVFDMNVLAVATGMPGHDRYALDFIRSIKPILAMHSGLNASGGVSNLSYSFRGNNAVRRAMHAVFLKLCREEGMKMAIAAPDAFALYDSLGKELREAAEDLLLMRKEDAADRLLRLAIAGVQRKNGGAGEKPREETTPHERIKSAIVEGCEDSIAADVELALKISSALEIVEGPLMEGMKEVGARFESGNMFLPQVLRSARVMKLAVEALGSEFGGLQSAESSGRILLATVKGDVHDIGKNITGSVLSCAGFKVIDLGVMTPCEKIIEEARAQKADVVGLSGLVTPSLAEMITVARAMENDGFRTPLLIGGAAASLLHTALKIVPVYSAPVVYVSDASRAGGVVRALLSHNLRSGFLLELRAKYEEALERHSRLQEARVTLSLEEARKNKVKIDWN
ncbi:MAG: methionine synthase [Spirochaetaceae bacterium]|jgi:5-methyltetrahydrofolate--homocysteine methyltransferase|nr:methionine synthase [Spirochaetaceae bacterium]